MVTKFLVIVLVLANMLLFGIKLSGDSTSITPAVASTASNTRSDIPGISLLAERPEHKLQFRTSEAQCFTIGPVDSAMQIRQLRSEFSEYISDARERISQAQVTRDFMVYLDQAESRAQALEFAQELGSMGLTDYFVIVSGSMENGISLGLYNDERYALKRRQDLRALGFNPQLMPRYEAVEQHWLDYRLAVGKDSPWDQMKESVPNALLLEVPCSSSLAEVVTESVHPAN